MFGTLYYPETNFEALEALGAASRSASANGDPLHIARLESNLMVLLSSAAGTGTNPTLDVKFQERQDATDAWADIPDHAWFNPADNSAGADAKFDQVTNAASFQVRGLKRQYLKSQLRAVATLGGTTPEFECSVIVVGFDRYSDRA